MFEIFPIRALSDNYVWILVEGEQAIIVDPGEAKPVLETFNELKLDLKGIIITHHHFDHTGGIQDLKDHFNCDVFGPGGGHIKGISNPLSFDAIIQEISPLLKANASLSFDRSKYNVRYRSGTFFDDLGDKLILDDIGINMSLVLKNK